MPETLAGLAHDMAYTAMVLTAIILLDILLFGYGFYLLDQPMSVEVNEATVYQAAEGEEISLGLRMAAPKGYS